MSSDRDEESFEEYNKGMPWLALDFKEQDLKDQLSDQMGVDGIPTLVLLDGDSGDILCKDATGYIHDGDEDVEHFPWKST